MNDDPDSTLEEFRRLLGELPPGPGGSVELVLSLLRPDAAELLRLAAIPHLVDRTVAAILMPDLSGERLDEAVAELLELSFVRADGAGGSLHDEARRYLLGQWIAARDADPGRWRRFREANARLADYYAGLRERGADAAAERSEVYHRIAAGEPGAIGMFRERFAAARVAFRLEGCEALVTILADLEPLLGESERGWLRYARARLLADQRQFDQARSMLEPLRHEPAVASDVDLTVLSLLCLHDVQRGQRDFPGALATLGSLLDYLGDKPGARGQQLEVTQTMAALLLKMRDTRRAEELLEGLLAAPETRSDPALLARTWNTMGLVHRRLNRPRRALAAFASALDVLEAAGERFRPMQVHNNIGALHAERADWDAARESLERALSIAQEAGDHNGEATALGNLARVYVGLSRPGEADAAALRAIELFRGIHNWYAAANLSLGLAKRQRREGPAAAARASFLTASDLYRLAGDEKAAARWGAAAEAGAGRSWALWQWLLLGVGMTIGAIALVAAVVTVMEG